MKPRSSAKVEQLQQWIRGIGIAMLVTEDRKGELRSRPMIVLDETTEGALWFVSDASSQKIDDIHAHRQVNLTYSDPETGRYISVSGRARLLRDKTRLTSLWNPKLSEWFPKGADDPELVLLRIEVHEAELWQQPREQFELDVRVGTGSASGHEVLTFA